MYSTNHVLEVSIELFRQLLCIGELLLHAVGVHGILPPRHLSHLGLLLSLLDLFNEQLLAFLSNCLPKIRHLQTPVPRLVADRIREKAQHR